MKQCRMCSQTLTRPGRLCRECERELERARQEGIAFSELPLVAGPRETVRFGSGSEWPARLRSPVAVVALAFVVGVAASVALQMNERAEAGVPRESVMLGAQAPLRRTSVVSPGASVYAPTVPVAANATVDVAAPSAPSDVATRKRMPAHDAAPVRMVSDARHATQPAAPSSGSEPASVRDGGAALGEALARCHEEPFLARPDCEERARARYCDAASALAQCMPATREYGQ